MYFSIFSINFSDSMFFKFFIRIGIDILKYGYRVVFSVKIKIKENNFGNSNGLLWEN